MWSSGITRRGASRAYTAMMHTVPHHHLHRLKERMHPALRQRLASMSATHRPSHGRLSVIVPCYNVEAYLCACLNSVIRSSYTDLEIIVVIDGSPDRSERIARGYARWDRRIRVVAQPNAGLGAARNTGVRLATGEWIAFLDSDDDVPKNAYEAMISTLVQSGSDFAVGSLQRHRDGRSWVPVWAKDVHRQDRIATNLNEFPQILADVFSWNKIFRRSFFDQVVGAFPEGIRYEDQEPAAKAYAAARAFDVLHQVVYTWHIRDDGRSITQQKASIVDLTDRLTVMGRVNDLLTSSASPPVIGYWQSKSVGLDLRAYYNEVPRTGSDYWTALVNGVRAVTKDMDESAWAGLSIHDRLIARLVEKDRRQDVCVILRHRSEWGDGAVLDLSVSPALLRPGYLKELEYHPTEADLRPGPLDDRLRVTLLGYRVLDGDIEVTGMAYVAGLDLGRVDSSLSACLVDEHGQKQSLPSNPSRFDDLILDELANDSAVSQTTSGFRIRLDMPSLVQRIAGAPHAVGDEPQLDRPWALQLTLEAAGRTWTSLFTTWDRRWTANRLQLTPIVDGARPVPFFTAAQGLQFRLDRPRVIAHDVAVQQGRELVIDVAERDGKAISHVSISCGPFSLIRTAATRPVDGHWRATIQVPSLPIGAKLTTRFVWGIRAHVGEERIPADFGGSTSALTASAGGGRLRPAILGSGRLRLEDSKMYASVTRVEVAEDARSFTVHGHAELPSGQTFAVTFASGAGETWPPARQQHAPSTNTFEAVFELDTTVFGYKVARANVGWSLRLLASPDRLLESLWVPISSGAMPQVSPHFLRWTRGERCSFRFTATTRARALWVNTRPALNQKEMSRAGQRDLRARIPALLCRPLRDTILFSCFGGRSAADSPLAVHDELRRRGCPSRLVWEVANGRAVIPEGTDSVVIGSSEHAELLHTSSHLVSNNNFPFWFRKHPDQFYLQTWHGTPLKRIGHDVPITSLSLSYRDLMRREPRAWDVLLAQNGFAAATLARAFDYRGEVLNLGYPRNDALATPSNERRRAVRSRLGVVEGARLVLYAPTWRDNVRSNSGGYALVNHLDLEVVSAAFDRSSTLLVRGHSNTPGLRTTPGSNILDVSQYPDINDLMLVADVLVTDYSSVMFDYVNTGRPMLFLAPDLAEYADQTRGFYLDFGQIAPGPILTTTDEVLGSLSSIDHVSSAFADLYSSFREQFAPRDDGRATARVVDAVWGRQN